MALVAQGATLFAVIALAFLGWAGQLVLLRGYYLRLDSW
jgi:hypothetical protein